MQSSIELNIYIRKHKQDLAINILIISVIKMDFNVLKYVMETIVYIFPPKIM